MSLEVGSRIMAIPDIGRPDALPMVGAPLERPYSISGDIPAEIIAGSVYGNPATLYPHQEQGGYDRALVERPVMSVVLENDLLRAVFLPEWGGRLWELFDKRSGKNLLHSPDTIQLANLGLRNAWFAGGIEWNIGTRGHSPTTASPLHAAVIRRPEGQEVLRLWEFDRLREVVFQVDAWLPEDSPTLFVAVRVRNPKADPVPMYWWTNAAVPQTRHTRVLAPADSAFASASSVVRRVVTLRRRKSDATSTSVLTHRAPPPPVAACSMAPITPATSPGHRTAAWAMSPSNSSPPSLRLLSRSPSPASSRIAA